MAHPVSPLFHEEPKNLGLIYFISQDGGITWKDAPNVLEDIISALEAPRILPLVACVNNQPEICYRITGEDQVERSTNGGETWKVDWKIPLGRKTYMEHAYPGVLCIGSPVSATPLDLVILSEEAGHSVIVAMGYEGVLMRAPQGEWHRVAVGHAYPNPYQTVNPLEIASTLSGEFCFGLFVALPVWMVVYLSIRYFLRRWLFDQLTPEQRALAKKRESRITGNAILTLLFLPWLFLILWTLGAIPLYEIALGLALLVALGILVLGVLKIRQVYLSVGGVAPSP
jgi:hypothetical protein